jgi:cytochrome c oxidase accessory protein FixG
VKGLGDCVDCTMCVQVCPTGIDIREGLQYECIACAACIDACDEVMDKVGYPRGLIRYDTQGGLEGERKRVLRPRTAMYATLLLVLLAGFVVSLSGRNVVAVEVMRDRNALFRERPDGWIENVYNVKIMNKDSEPHEFRITGSGLPGLEVDYAGPRVRVGAGQVESVPVRLRVERGAVSGGTDLVVAVEAADQASLRASGKARFIAPTD